MSDRLSIIACSYRLEPEEMVHRVRKLFSGRRIELSGFVVSAHLCAPRDLGDGWTALPTDNEDFDFSAYFTGAQALVARGLDDRPAMFLNDTLFTNHAAAANFNASLRLLGLMQEFELPAIVGKTDRYTTVCLRNPWSGLDRYVTTYCFLLNTSAIAILLSLRDMASHEAVTHAFDVGGTGWGSGLDRAFREFVKASLVYRRSPYLWYRLHETTYSDAQLRSKARCIYFEHRLSGAIGRDGCILPSNAGPRLGSYLSVHEWLGRLRRTLHLSR